MVNGIIADSMLFLRQNFKIYISYILKFCALPTVAYSYLFAQLFVSHPQLLEQMSTGKASPELIISLLPSLSLPMALMLVTHVFFFCLVYGHIEQYIETPGQQVSISEILKSGSRRFLWQLIGFILLLGLLVALMMLIGMLGQATKGISFIAFSGVIYLLVPMGLVSPILYFEKDGGFNSAFARSMFLIRKSWLHLLTAFFMTFCIVVSFSFLMGLPIQLINSAINFLVPKLAKTLLVQTIIQSLGNISSLIAVGFISIAGSLIYFSQVDKLDPKKSYTDF